MSNFNGDYSLQAKSNVQQMSRNMNFLSKDFESSSSSGHNHHSKASSVSFLDFNNSGGSNQFGRIGGNAGSSNGSLGKISTQTVSASPSTAMAILSPPSSRYAFDRSAINPENSNSSFYNSKAKPNYSNLGNDWALNLNFSLSSKLNSSNPELQTGDVSKESILVGDKDANEIDKISSSLKESSKELSDKMNSIDLNQKADKPDVITPEKSLKDIMEPLKSWLDDTSLEEKHSFIEELIEYFLFTPNNSSDLINFMKVQIDRVSFNDDLDSPTSATAPQQSQQSQQHISSGPTLHQQQPSGINNLDSILSSASMNRFSHSRSNSANITPSNNGNGEGTLKQTILSINSNVAKDQPQVFSPLLTESGFLQNQAMIYANGSRNTGNNGTRGHSKSASISNMSGSLSVNTSGNQSMSSSGKDLLAPAVLMSPLNGSFSTKRNNNSLSISTNTNGSGVPSMSNGPNSAKLQSAALSLSTVSGHNGNGNVNGSQPQINGSALTSPTSPITPGGYNLDGLDPQTRLKLQALSTINSRSKLDALKKTAYSTGSVEQMKHSSQNSTGSQMKNYKVNGVSNKLQMNQSKGEAVTNSAINNGLKKRYETKGAKADELSTTPVKHSSSNSSSSANKSLAQALKTLQVASSEAAAFNGINDNSVIANSSLLTPSKQLSNNTLSLLSPKSPGLNSTELIELKNLNDLPVWLKNLRLHKYTKILENYNWKQLIYLTNDELEKAGVSALGARRKLLKAFDIVKVAYENGDIIGLEN